MTAQQIIKEEITLLQSWIDQSKTGGWSTHLVKPMEDRILQLQKIHFELSSTSSSAGDQQFRSPDMAEALRLKWITLTEDMGRMLSGQRGVSIDKLNKVMNLVQEFVNTLPASLSSPGSGWVNLVDELPNYGTIDVWVSDEYSKRRIPNSEYRQRDFYNKSDWNF